MFKNKIQMNAFLSIAEEMQESGKLSVEEYDSVINYIEETYYHPESFWPTVARWIDDIFSAEDIASQKEALHKLLEAYLYTEAANNHKERERILLLARRIKNFFTDLEKYHREDIQKELRTYLKFG